MGCKSVTERPSKTCCVICFNKERFCQINLEEYFTKNGRSRFDPNVGGNKLFLNSR